MDEPPIIRIPLSGFVVHGDPDNVRMVPNPTATRIPADQEEQERCVAGYLAQALERAGRTWENLRSNPDDPPDVLGEEDAETFGLELGEVRLQQRAHDVAQLERFRSRIYDEIRDLRPQLQGKTLRIFFSDPLALEQEIPRRRALKRLLRSVVEGIAACRAGADRADLEPPLSGLVVEARPGVRPPPDPADPSIAFNAEIEATTPTQVRIAALRIARDKLERDRCPGGPSYLLLWSRDEEIYNLFLAAREGVIQAIRETGLAVPESARRSPYDEIHLLALSRLGRASHFSIRRNK